MCEVCHYTTYFLFHIICLSKWSTSNVSSTKWYRQWDPFFAIARCSGGGTAGGLGGYISVSFHVVVNQLITIDIGQMGNVQGNVFGRTFHHTHLLVIVHSSFLLSHNHLGQSVHGGGGSGAYVDSESVYAGSGGGLTSISTTNVLVIAGGGGGGRGSECSGKKRSP